jgi:8-oxo-dGTP pyrophosphatase MutT (NUDIX family)
MKSNLQESFIYEGKETSVEWFDLLPNQRLPDVLWSQVYAVGELDGDVPVVMYQDKADSLPGGSPERGETIDVALNREIQEELNCRVTSWIPLGYQKINSLDAESIYQLRVYAVLETIGPFMSDPGGDVIGYKLVPLSMLNDTLGWGKRGDKIEKLALRAKRQIQAS